MKSNFECARVGIELKLDLNHYGVAMIKGEQVPLRLGACRFRTTDRALFSLYVIFVCFFLFSRSIHQSR